MIKTIFYCYFLALMVFSCERTQMDFVGTYSLETSTIWVSESLELHPDFTFFYEGTSCTQTKRSEGTWTLEKGVVILHSSEELRNIAQSQQEELPFKEEVAVSVPQNDETQQDTLENITVSLSGGADQYIFSFQKDTIAVFDHYELEIKESRLAGWQRKPK